MSANVNHPADEATLSRTLGLLDITMIGVGAMIGAGIFVLTGIAAGEAGPALALAFLLNGIVTTFTALSYAELGSCFPEAGGGYLWVKEGLGGTQGFLAGWMSWFAHAVACSLYGLGFGRFGVELIILAAPEAEAYADPLALGLMIIIVVLFAFINYRGASETGLIGNVVTIAKIVILAIFVAFGIRAMVARPDLNVFTDSFLPNGIGGVFVAMGLTFIAFEGYEIIAQSGEEVKDPKRNIPRAVFISIAIAVTVYLLVAVVAIGAVTVPAASAAPNVWEYLAEAREIAIVRAAEQFMGRWGGILILISGLASTMSALNATVYSSSRVSFAMGRGRNLPDFFGRIHSRLHTPHWAIAVSAVLIIIMALALPIDQVAKAADVMFLFMFAQVNVTLIRLRRLRPDLDRGFLVPLFPWPAIIGIITNVLLASFLVLESGTVGLVTVLWLSAGAALYWFVFRHRERAEKPALIPFARTPVSADYTVLMAAATREQVPVLMRVGAAVARAENGGLLGLHVIEVPPPLPLAQANEFVDEHRPVAEAIRSAAAHEQLPVHTVLRVARDAEEAISETAAESAADLILLNWRTFEEGKWHYSSVIDPLLDDSPADIALVRAGTIDRVQQILVPVAGGPNSRLAARIARALALQDGTPATVTLLHVATPNVPAARRAARARRAFREAAEGIDFPFVETILEAASPVEGILAAAAESDVIVIGAAVEPMLRKWRVDNVARRVADHAACPVIIAQRRRTPLR